MTLRRRFSSPIAAAVVLTLTTTSCDFTELGGGERGSGNLVTETRQVSPFTRIDVSSAVNLDVIIDPTAQPTVVVTYDDNILDNLITRVDGATLTISFDGSVNLTGSGNRIVEVTMPLIDSIRASGATDVTAVGATPRLVLDVSGASTLDLEELTVGDVDVDASGASTVVLFVTGSATGSASGASNVAVRGNPADVRIETSGASSLDLP
jgi:hypothetical protein